MLPQLMKRCVLCWVSVVSETLRLVALLQIVRHRVALGIPQIHGILHIETRE